MSFERRKVRVGRVVSDRMDKTVVVVIEWRRPHRIYKKAVKRQTRFKAHDPGNECKTGDLVRIIESRPRSRTKRWRVAQILQREEIAEVQPQDIRVEDESVLVAERETAPEEGVEEEVEALAVDEQVQETLEEVEEEQADVAMEEAEAPEGPVAEAEQAEEEESEDSGEEDEGQEERQP